MKNSRILSIAQGKHNHEFCQLDGGEKEFYQSEEKKLGIALISH